MKRAEQSRLLKGILEDQELAEFELFFGSPDAAFETRWIDFLLKLSPEPAEADR